VDISFPPRSIVFHTEDDGPPPRHRKEGRARKRGSTTTGRHLLAVDEPASEQGAPESTSCDCPPGYHEYGAHAPGARPQQQSQFPVPPGAYPVEDLAGMSTSAAAMLLHRATIEAETEAANCPHLLITQDTATGVITYSGPFPTGLEALHRAHDFVEKYRGLKPRWDFTLTVAPLFPD